MNYARQTYNQGEVISPKKRKSKKRNVMQTTCGIFGLCQTSKRPKRNKERQGKECPKRTSANGILRNIFLPRHIEINEREFYNSLSKIAKYYNFTPIESESYPYPKNIRLAFQDAEEKIQQNRKGSKIELHLFKHSNKGIYLSVSEIFDTCMTLFHIPVKPLYLLSRKNKPLSDLFLSVYAYYLQIVKLPYYSNESDYLGYLHEMLKEWIKEDFYDEEESQEHLTELEQAKFIGDTICKKIKNKKNLDFFKHRLNHFFPKNEYEKECKKFAEEIYTLYQTYPNENIFRYDNYVPEEYEDYEKITIDKYIGFVASCDDWLSDQILQMINNEFNECAEQIEPTIRRDFIEDCKDSRNFDFENRLFNSIPKLYHLITKV